MAPWAALWLAALGVAILVQSGDPPAALVWSGRVIAVSVGVTALAVIAEHATGVALGIDQVWFGQAVRETESIWPGRPAAPTALAALLLSAAVALIRGDRPAIRTSWLVCLAGATATSWVAIVAYLLDSMDMVNAGEASGVAMITALALLMLCAATLLTRPDRNPVGWLLAQPNRGVLARLAVLFLGFPFIVGLSRFAFLALGFGTDAALAQSAVVGTIIAAGVVFHLSGREQRLLAAVAAERTLLRATADGMLDPQVLLEAIRDQNGKVVDFRYLMVNHAACAYLNATEDDLVDRTLLDLSPNMGNSVLFERYVQCLTGGEPMILTGFPHFSDILGVHRRYDIRATRAGTDLLTLSWTDVTEQFRSAQLLAESEQRYRLLAENAADVVCHVRDGEWVWVSPSVESVLDAPAEYWPGRRISEVTLPEDYAVNAPKLAAVAAGGSVQERIRVVSARGVLHWLDVHAKPFYGQDGRQDGMTATLRLVDDQVAAEVAAAEAQRRQAYADARYRRLIDNSVVATSLNTVDGRFVLVNQAMCDFFGYDADTLLHKTWQELTAPEYREQSRAAVEDMLADRRDGYRTIKQYIHADGHRIWGDLSLSRLNNSDGEVEHLIRQIIDITAQVEARQRLEEARIRRAEADALARGLIENSVIATALATLDGRFVQFNQAMCDLVGYDAATLGQMSWQDITATEFLEAELDAIPAIISGEIDVYRVRKQFLHANGRRTWGHLSLSVLRNADGEPQHLIGQIADITADVEMREQLEEARRQQAIADARYRRSMDHAAIGMCLITPEGRFEEVNEALCKLFGYDAETLKQKTWQELTAPGYLDADLKRVEEILAGRLESYRMLKQYVHADGHLIWGDLSVSCIRDERGRVENFVSQIADITAAVEANERNALLNQRITEELSTAAAYVESILPRGLTGDVCVSSRYLPSQELGGDCFDYSWIDDDHLMVYLIDVSGHGIEPALLAVSLQNMLRSRAFTTETLLAPELVMAELNQHFQMEQHGEHYFTMWYGVYERSTRVLRYANAGAPPAFAFDPGAESPTTATELSSNALPVGAFERTSFRTDSYTVPAGCRILIFSDGASEQTLADGSQLSLRAFRDLVSRLAASVDFTIDTLVDELRLLTPNGVFEDDFSLIYLTFE
ncbi:MAG: PAS domain S-box protein [Mycobacterium sp.]|nr:MAG: PAS domain S-box protein [Mycobacterium sp.]